MIYIRADESGCLGFDFTKKGTKKHLLVTFLISKEYRPILSLVKKIVKTLPKKQLRKNNSYLHANYEKPVTRKRLLRGLTAIDIKIATIRLDKRKTVLIGNPNELYSNMFVTLINRLYADGVLNKSDSIDFVASRRNTSEKLNNDFSASIEHGTKNIDFNHSIAAPSDDKCLQAVDFVSWALWQKYEMDDNTYSDIIADKIIKEYEMYK